MHGKIQDKRLGKSHYRAIELRYEGVQYEEMRQIIKRETGKEWNISTVKHWFATGGMLEKPYLEYAEQQNEARRKMAMQELKKLIPLIPVHYRNLLTRKGKDGKLKADKLTQSTLRELCRVMAIQMEERGGGNDPLEQFFDRLDAQGDDGGGEAGGEADESPREVDDGVARPDDVPVPEEDQPGSDEGALDGGGGDAGAGDGGGAAPAVR